MSAKSVLGLVLLGLVAGGLFVRRLLRRKS